MRDCPRCKVSFETVKKPFAEVDVCPSCGGAFFDPGEAIGVHGADAEAGFLVKDGRARYVRASALACPSAAHPARAMDVYAIEAGWGPAIEIDYCPACSGFFLDQGEGAALAALEQGETKTEGGATFASPPPAGAAQERAIEEARSQRGGSLFEMFFGDVLRASAQAPRALDAAMRRRRLGFRSRR